MRLHVPRGRLSRLIAECADGALALEETGPWTVHVLVENGHRPFDTSGWMLLNRGAWQRGGKVVVEDVCGSGFDMHVRCEGDVANFTFRSRPPPRTRAAGFVLPTRSRLLARSVLLHYPAMWWAGTRGRTPLHAPAVTSGATTSLLAGPGGVGKSTLISRETSQGGRAASDNVSVSDGTSVWGVVEPVRSEQRVGRRMPHGRRESSLQNRVASLRPDQIVVLRRGPRERIQPCDPEVAARTLITSTYMAGELRRYWTFAALLALGTGAGPPHPPVAAVAAAFAHALPCFEVELPAVEGVRLSTLLARSEVVTWT